MKCSARKDCSFQATLSRLDFNIKDDDFKDLHAGYQSKTTIHKTRNGL